MRGPTVLVFVLILATAALVATVWEFQSKEALLGRDTEPVAHKLENVGVSAALVAASLIIPLWLLGGADDDRLTRVDHVAIGRGQLLERLHLHELGDVDERLRQRPQRISLSHTRARHDRSGAWGGA